MLICLELNSDGGNRPEADFEILCNTVMLISKIDRGREIDVEVSSLDDNSFLKS
ncbi:hypothetical protein P368_17280 [Comamonas thiooxydans]|nr:hypothetical protein P369_14710 [Comamonas thiooxydans]KGG97242.1 hypothetical protein P367_16890 [Comamonas thiooxydans]KGH00429.1 hypothetical protein P365_21095 [Comamonas thiooxydans]KGH09878.1 hypothetical protein P368_17280 [Comamonas thiooxydans]